MHGQVTAEGDFIVLLLQTARFLINCCRDARAGKALSGLAEYLQPLQDPGNPRSALAYYSPLKSPEANFACLFFLSFDPLLSQAFSLCTNILSTALF